ncbi:stabilin-1 isoform X1 [Chiloscyllium punctatum]|uniref:stabilin-1 isoform X1 n=1 Tax=Chiloscyllium punctatum TaxID=137246 RepID=UPI003B63550A
MESVSLWRLAALGLFLLLTQCPQSTTAQNGKKRQKCKEQMKLTTATACTSCAISQNLLCPRGFQKITQDFGIRDCSFTVDLGGEQLIRQVGCRHLCTKTATIFKCCTGFWSQDCLECPGGSTNPCSGHGICLDGVSGNGTCICEPKYKGSVCEECADEEAYGPDCVLGCRCVHGICSNGITGNGKCICFSGYTGPQCDQEHPACKSLQCGKNTQCVEETKGTFTCKCLPGFLKSERTCKAIDPCTTNICDKNADCEHLGEGKYKCTCHLDYRGNGKICLPINPCSVDNGGCPENSTQCMYEGPGKSSCKCKDGFAATNSSQSCILKDVCKPSLCNKTAKCVTVSPGNFECVCKPNEIGDGRKCIGSIREVIQKLITNQYSTASLQMFENGCTSTLSNMGPFTVFLPLVKKLKNNQVIDTKKFSCKQHIVPGVLLLEDFKNITTFETLTGDTVEVTQTRKYFQLIFQNKRYNIMRGNKAASNGIIHTIDRFLSGNVEKLGDPQKTVADILAAGQLFSRFETILENCDLPFILDGPGPYTVFVPSNDAVDKMRDGTLFYMFGEGRPKLQELVKHHIFASGNLPADRLSTMPRILTKANQIISINVTINGQILLGDKGVPLHKRDIIASNGIIHTLDGILIPPSILPILPKRCDEIHYRIITAPCGDCSSLNESHCPEGSTPMETYVQNCVYDKSIDDVIYSRNSGCARHCNQTIVKPGCCKGFFGPDCKPCLGGFKNPCYGHGQCLDGFEGDGSCKCYSSFKGIACHICSGDNKHGENCDQDCPCLHGICDNRPENGGICQPGTCAEGYTGTFCDKETESCGPSGLSQFCHAFAVCEYDNGSTRCVCKNGYEGDGISCREEDLCKKPNRGGCAENAECFSLGPGNITCLCNTGWTGDGRVCTEINECLLNTRGGCDDNADCQYIGPAQSRCTCKRGYAGDGKKCTLINPCLEENGGCHVMAECEPTENGNRKCTCLKGYAGDGIKCFGDILTELASSAYFSGFNNWLKKSLHSMEFPAGANMTVLVPSETAINNMEKAAIESWEQTDRLLSIVKSHFIMGRLAVDDLKEYEGQKLPTMNIFTRLLIKNENGNLTIGGARIVIRNIPAVNGYIHIIDQILFPPSEDLPPLLPSLLDLLEQLPQYSHIKQLLQHYHLIDEIESSEQYTILIPEDTSIEEYCRAKDIEQLDVNAVQYHIILGEKFLYNKIKDGIHRGTMLGSSYQVIFYTKEDKIFVNDVALNGFHNETRNGILLGTSQVLQMQKNRCDINNTVIVEGVCGSCDDNPICPQGTIAMEFAGQIRTETCFYKEFQNDKDVELLGCKPSCVKETITLKCCFGYFGPMCQMCPGKPDSWCSNFGICQDDINGTGECLCREGFQGTACESCEAGRYGPSCELECLCVNGKCNDGLNGDGTCNCFKSWRGINCDVGIVNDYCNGTCHPNANCLPGSPDSLASCICSAGYTGNGTYCSEINLCEVNNGGCSVHSNCTKVSAGERTCTCHDGYVGDGLICLEIDGCTEGNGGCHEKAECTKTGPKRVACNCFPGYSGDGRNSCVPINPCEKNNGDCGPFANCEATGPGIRKCICKRNYIKVGLSCRGKISQELVRKSDAALFYKYLQANGIKELNGKGPFTVFVPRPDTLTQDNTMEEWKTRGLIGDLLRYHIVGCGKLLYDDLRKHSSLIALSGNAIRISWKQNAIYLNGDAQIITSDYLATNGIVHYINKILVPYNLTSTNRLVTLPLHNISTVANANGYKVFSTLIKETNLLPLLEDPIHRPFTMLWPTDEAFSSLPKERKDWLYSNENRHNLVAYLKFHMIRDSKTLAADLPLISSRRTMRGSLISVRCSRTIIGDLIVNDGSAQIVQRHLEFDGGIAYGINSLLEPPHIGARCDALTMHPARGPCGSCLNPPACPLGTKPQDGTDYQSCWYNQANKPGRYLREQFSDRINTAAFPFKLIRGKWVRPGHLHAIRGCSRQCVNPLWIPQCCKHHYGPYCQVCPGGIQSPCSSHGSCNDRRLGNGTCQCSVGFSGTACELCETGRYGPNCKKCNCTENAICDEGISGAGTCFCREGWTGKYCETRFAVKSVCSPKCDRNAVCRSDNICECNPYYEGDGRKCTVVDRCKNNNGGCHQYAACSQSGINITCTCQPGHEGDGYFCSPIDRCVDGRNGGCSEHAICINIGPNKRRCECKEGFRGDGIQCLVNAKPPRDRCLERNLCHPNAFCNDLHFQDKTAGVFHLQSPIGKYRFTFEGATAACNAEGATLASFDQLATAQQFGYHLCVIGWMADKKAGYPTTHINPNCGSNKIGIMDYGVQTNLSALWDAYCFREEDIQCVCKEGFVGDGYSCNGNLVEVLSSNSNFSVFYSKLLDYANATEEGMKFLEFLSNETTNETLFVPLNSGFRVNETLSWRDLENHISRNNSFIYYDELSADTPISSRLGYDLLIDETGPANQTLFNGSKLVNGRHIMEWDLVASNGIIHVIEGPLITPQPVLVSANLSSGVLGATLLLGLGCLIAAIVGVSFCLRRRREIFQFQYFKANDDDGIGLSAEDNPALVSVPNPVYGAYGIVTDSTTEPFEDNDEYEYYSDTQNILQD